jgi:hypothetical protein
MSNILRENHVDTIWGFSVLSLQHFSKSTILPKLCESGKALGRAQSRDVLAHEFRVCTTLTNCVCNGADSEVFTKEAYLSFYHEIGFFEATRSI